MRSWLSVFSMVVIAIVAGLVWTATATAQTEFKITATERESDDRFGWTVSISGNLALVGAIQDDDNGTNSGSAYIFSRTDGNWIQSAKLTASDASSSDNFGMSVSISGEYAVIGVPHSDDNGASSGSAYVFQRTGNSWIQHTKLTASDAAAEDLFGTSVSISGDYLLVSAPLKNEPGLNNSGALYLFERNGSTWNQTAKLVDHDNSTDTQDLRFGQRMSTSGNRAIIGVEGRLDPVTQTAIGSAYIFERDSDGDLAVTAKLIADDTSENGGTYSTYFGQSVAINGDYALVGARYSAFFFEKDQNGNWVKRAKVHNGADFENSGGGGFGEAVAIGSGFAIVGAGNQYPLGEAFIYRRIGNSWQHFKTVSNAPTGYFGSSVAIDGDFALVGAPEYTDQNVTSGAAYVYEFLPEINISPSLISFYQVAAGASDSKSIKIRNTGSNDLIISGISVGGTDASHFSVSPATLSIGVGDSAQVNVTFSAGESTDPRTAFLEITHNAEGSPSIVTLNANRVSYAGEYLVSTFAGTGDRRLWDDYRLEAEFNYPTGIDVDLDGKIYIADQHNNALRIIDTMGNVSSVKDVGIYIPLGLAIGPDGVYFTSSNLIKKLDSSGNVTTVAGSSGEFNGPQGIVVAPSGVIFVADFYNHRVRTIDLSGNVSTFAGGQEGFLDGASDVARFKGPINLVLDVSGNLFVSDHNNQVIRKIDTSGNVTTFAGTPQVAGYADGLGVDALFYRPAGLAIDANGNIFVADASNNRIRMIDVNSNVTTVAGRDNNPGTLRDGPGPEATFNYPLDLTIGAAGEIYVADTEYTVIRKITPINPQIAVGADTLDFGGLQVGRVKPDSLSISNPGATPLTISSMTLAGAGKDHFNLPISSFALAEGQSRSVAVNFAPTSPGSKSGVLIIEHDAPNSPFQVQLSGTGIDPPLMAALPDTLKFGVVEGGDLKTINAVMVNKGATPAYWSWPSIGGNQSAVFHLPDEFNTSEKRIDPGDTLVIPVTFAPTDSANYAAELSMQYDGPGSPLKIVLTGLGHPEPNLRLVLGDAYAMRGEKVHVPLVLHNTSLEDVSGLQFDIATPDTLFTFTGVTDSLSGLGFTVSGQATSSGATILVFTTTTNLIPAGQTVLGSIIYDVAPVIGPQIRNERTGTIHFVIDNAEIVDANTNVKSVKHRAADILVGIRGDASGDGTVSISDLVLTVRVILGSQPPPVLGTFQFARHDGNNDAAINVADVIYQVNRILGRPIDQPLSKVVYSPVTVDLNQPMASGTALYLPVTIDTDTPISGLQLAYAYDPSLVTIGEPRMAVPSDDVTLEWYTKDGILRVIAYSISGEAIVLGRSALMIPVTVPEGSTPEITLTEAVLSDPSGRDVPVRLGQTRVAVAAAPTSFSLSVARPNPFNPSTTIAYEMPEQTHVTLTIYNLLGQKVIRLLDQVQAAGRYEAVWHGVNSRGAGVASGVYLYRIVSGSGYTETKRMTLLK